MDPITVLLTALFAAPTVVTEDDLTLPQGCRPAQAAETLQAHVGPAVHFDEVIVGYSNSLGQIEFSATINGRRAHGKGAMDCSAGEIVAFGIGPEDGHRTGRLCPPARTGTRPPAPPASRGRATRASRSCARRASVRRRATAR